MTREEQRELDAKTPPNELRHRYWIHVYYTLINLSLLPHNAKWLYTMSDYYRLYDDPDRSVKIEFKP